MIESLLYRKIAIFGHFGRGNLGDEATLATVLMNVRKRRPDAEVYALTANPWDTEMRHNVMAQPIRRINPRPVDRSTVDDQAENANEAPIAQESMGFLSRLKGLLKSIPLLGGLLVFTREIPTRIQNIFTEVVFLFRSSSRLKGTDLFIVAGGGQLGDYFEGVWGYPFTIFKWTLLARLRGAKIVFLSVGAGPVNSRISRLLFRWSLSMAEYRSFRDQHSRRLVEQLGISPGRNLVVPDVVHGLKVPASDSGTVEPTKVVGINPLPFHDPRYWAVDDTSVYRKYIQTFASFSIWLIEQGYEVILFPTQVRADPPVIADIVALVHQGLPAADQACLRCPRIKSITDVLVTIKQADLIVASRFHAIVMSLLLNRPVLGLSYDPKSDDLMTDVGLGKYVSDIAQFDLRWLQSRIQELCEESESARDRIERRSSDYRSRIGSQYDRLLQVESIATEKKRDLLVTAAH